MDEIKIKTELYKIAWNLLGIPAGAKAKGYIKTFLKTPQYITGYKKYWDQNPVLSDRLGVSDDMQTQRFSVFLSEEFVAFVVAKLEFENTTDLLERSPAGELTT